MSHLGFTASSYSSRPGARRCRPDFADYDREHHQFEDVTLAWDEQDFLERIAELVAGDCSLHEAVDWIVVEGARHYSIGQWADVRGVTEDAVRANVNTARRKLLAEEYRKRG